ncbi:MAG: hypothetical protein ACK6A7_03895 [Planctomycetota bacterium]|jgi:hypothetical protein
MIIGKATKRRRKFDVVIEAEFQPPHILLGNYLWDIGLPIEDFIELADQHHDARTQGTISGDSYRTVFAFDAVGIMSLYEPDEKKILSALTYVQLLKAWQQAHDRFQVDQALDQPIEIRIEESLPRTESADLARQQMEIANREML